MVLLSIMGLVLGCIVGYFFVQREYGLLQTILYSGMLALGISLLVGMITGGLWSVVLLIVLVILALILLPVAYSLMKKGFKLEDIVDVIGEAGILATSSIPVIFLIILAVLGGIFIVTAIIVMFYMFAFFVKFGIPLIVGAIATRIIMGLAT